MTLKFLGKKVGMTTLFDKKTGRMIPCTVVQVPSVHVTADITVEKQGYEALQCAAFSLSESQRRRQSRPQSQFFEKIGVEPKGKLYEFRISREEKEKFNLKVGDELSLELACSWGYVDVAGISKGKGTQGSMKRYGMAGGPASHGSGFHRHTGSRGQRSTPGRTFLGQGDPGRMGNERVTVMSNELISVDLEKRCFLIKGSLPGPCGAVIEIRKAVKVQG